MVHGHQQRCGRWLACTAALVCGCTFGSDSGAPGPLGVGGTAGESSDDGADGASDAESSTAGTDATTDGTGTQPGTLSSPGDDADDGADSFGESSGGADSSDGDGIDDCIDPAPYTQIVLASDAVVAAPMAAWAMPALPGNECAASEVEDEGLITFPWNAPCDDEYHLWARVWDRVPGAEVSGDPDSYYVKLDADGGEAFWRYGCQTLPNPFNPSPPAWHWVRLRESITCVFDSKVITYTTNQGPHTFVFRNRENGAFDTGNPPGQIAAIARILVTNDPSYVPDAND